jgi:hypothetical protein
MKRERIKVARSSRRERPWLEVLPLDPGGRARGPSQGGPTFVGTPLNADPRLAHAGRVGLMQVGDPQEVTLWEHIRPRLA